MCFEAMIIYRTVQKTFAKNDAVLCEPIVENFHFQLALQRVLRLCTDSGGGEATSIIPSRISLESKLPDQFPQPLCLSPKFF